MPEKPAFPHPEESGKLPPYVLRALEKAGLDTAGFLYACTGDLDNEACFCDAWLAFDAKGVYCATGKVVIEPSRRRKSKRHKEPVVQVQTVSAVPIGEVERLSTEQYVSTGRLIAECGGEQRSIMRFSVGRLGSFDRFVKCFNTYKTTGKAEVPDAEKPDGGKCRKCGAPCPPGKDLCRKHDKHTGTAVRLFRFFGGYLPQVTAILCIMLVSAAVSAFVPQISTRALYDDVLANPNGLPVPELMKALGVLVLSIFGIRLLNTVLTVVQQYMSASIMPGVMYDIKLKIFNAMQRLSVGFYSSKQTGSLMDRVTEDANNIYWFFTDGMPRVIMDVGTVIGIIILMFRMNVRLSLIALGSAVVLVVIMVFGDKGFRRMHHRVWAFHARLGSAVSDSINGQRVIKAFAKEDDEYERFRTMSDDVRRAELKLSLTEATLFPIMETLVLLVSAVVLAVGGVMVAKAEMTLGTLLSYIVYLEMLAEPFGFLGWVSNWWSRCADSAQRVFEICDAKPDITESENAKCFDNLQGTVEIRDLEFEYEPARPIIRKLSMHVDAGQMLGIVGKTGAGKSTIANLIARLYDAGAGTIKIDGIDVRELKLTELRRNIGLVSQDIYLFIGTIADNIRYAKPDATMDEVIAAAKAASAHDFIMKLPDAYETRVGAGGQKLSGGERQRVSIARTIIQNPKILILDEATAAMDTETERKIQQSLFRLKTGRTTIAIAHRLSTLRDADHLIVIDEGRTVEYGTFAELMQQKGELYKQYKIQSEALKNLRIGEEDETNGEEEEA